MKSRARSTAGDSRLVVTSGSPCLMPRRLPTCLRQRSSRLSTPRRSTLTTTSSLETPRRLVIPTSPSPR
ncbi:High mobility group B protein 2 [Zea mays]|uniref:High mobility group B protein 2 n=1 Tax=Zea mays TaxID=4577 RepID=A0A1D6IAX8_MAIZE|nr:High mobility group B protein 2 [Zea mays]